MSAPYHSYWNRDFMNIEEHFGDNTNSFAAFDKLVTALHSNGMKIIVDEANNHSNPDNCGENGSLYNNGTFMAAANNDPEGLLPPQSGHFRLQRPLPGPVLTLCLTSPT